MEELHAFLRLAADIADDESAELRFPRQHLFWLFQKPGRRPGIGERHALEMTRAGVDHIERKPQVSRVVQVMGRQRIVAVAKVRSDGLAGVENSRTAVKPVMMAGGGEHDKIRLVADLQVVAGAQRFRKKVPRLRETSPKIHKIDTNLRHGSALDGAPVLVRSARSYGTPAGSMARN